MSDKPEFILNLAKIKTVEDVLSNLQDIYKCEYERYSNENCSWFYQVLSIEGDNRLCIPYGDAPLKKGISASELDRMVDIFSGFSWSGGELYLNKRIANHKCAKDIDAQLKLAKDRDESTELYYSFFPEAAIEVYAKELSYKQKKLEELILAVKELEEKLESYTRKKESKAK